MSLLFASLIAFGAYLAFDRWLLPLIEGFAFKSLIGEITRIGWVAAFAFLRKVVLVATATLGGFWLLAQGTAWLNETFTGFSWMTNATLSFVVGVKRMIGAFGGWKTAAVLGLLGLMWLFLVIRNLRVKAIEVLGNLKKKAAEGILPPYEGESDLQMQELEEQIAQARGEYFRLIYVPDASLTPQYRWEKHQYLDVLRKRIPKLEKQLEDLRLPRRLVPELTGQKGTAEATGSGWWSQFMLFFTSKGMARAIGQVSGGFASIGLILMVLSYVAASRGPLTKGSDGPLLRFAEMQLQAKSQQLDSLWEKEMKASTPPKAVPPKENPPKKSIPEKPAPAAQPDSLKKAGDQKIGATSNADSLSNGRAITQNPTSSSAASSSISGPSSGPASGSTTDFDPDNPDGPSPQEGNWSAEDERALNFLARQFELAIGRTLAPAHQTPRVDNSYKARVSATRVNILKAYVRPADGPPQPDLSVEEPGARIPNSAPPKTKQAREFIQTFDQESISAEPQTNFGKAYREELRTAVIQPQNQGFWGGVKQKIRGIIQEFRIAASPEELVGMAVGQAACAAFEAHSGAPTMLNDIAAEIVERTGSRAIKYLINIKQKLFSKDLQQKATFEDALGNIKTPSCVAEDFVRYAVEDHDFVPLGDFDQLLHDFQPSLTHEEMKSPAKATAKEMLQKFAYAQGDKTGETSEALSDFETHFPGQAGPWNDNIYPDAPKPGGGGSGGSGVLAMAANRARNFGQLRGFRRIGGVLLGREAENKNTRLDFRNMHWKERDGRVEIFLNRADGKTLSAGSFEKDVVHQALAYVADGRLVATTMISAQPFPFFKILVHPALVNTEIGCKAIGVDRLVDKYSLKDDQVKKTLNAFRFQSVLYQYASFKMATNKASYADRVSLEFYLTKFEFEIENNWSKIYEVLGNGDLLSDPERSHIAAKPAYYNQTVVEHLQYCLANCYGQFSVFKDLLVKEDIRVKRLEDILKAKTEEWSGVREMQYSIDENLSFLHPVAGRDNELFPLQFIRQIVYVPLQFSEGDTPSVNESVDENPWEFPELQRSGTIQKLVYKGISTDPADRRVFERMRDFTLLQRLFRVAMNGQLGYDFPVEKLYNLAMDTRYAVINTETPTWNYSQQADSMAVPQVSTHQQAYLYYLHLCELLGVRDQRNLSPCN